jgi:hypothetical protein
MQEWGAQGAFPLLQTLWLSHNWLQSSLPPSWGLAAAFPKLKSLRLDRNRINGSLPEEWGAGAGFLNLQVLVGLSDVSLLQMFCPSVGE